MQKDILFDNIYIGHSLDEAEQFRKETYDVKSASEMAEKEADEKKEAEEAEKFTGLKFTENPVEYVKEKVNLFVTIAKSDPIGAIKFVPEVAGGAGVLLVTLIVLIFGGIGGAAKSPKVKDNAQKAKDAAADAKDKAADAISSGAEKMQGEVNKRTTRSSAAADGSS